MLTKVEIQNFKSVRRVSFDARRVNVFIGEPNTGKTNILEALALLSEGVHGPSEFKEVFRFRSIADLFTDHEVSAAIRVLTPECRGTVSFQRPRFEFSFSGSQEAGPEVYYAEATGTTTGWVNLQYGIKYYRFKPAGQRSAQAFGALQPPFGVNLTSVLYTNKELRRRVSALFRARDFTLEIRPVEAELGIRKNTQDEFVISFPYESISETWQRIVFLMTVLETNRDATLLLDEPEAHTFPFYTKYFAERIALDETNQFFITTHNPYLLSSVVEKTFVGDLAVFVTRLENFETKLDLVPDQKLPELLELGPDTFFNLDKLVDG